MSDVEWHGRGTAYYAVNTVHIRLRASGEGITTTLIRPRAPSPCLLLELASSRFPPSRVFFGCLVLISERLPWFAIAARSSGSLGIIELKRDAEADGCCALSLNSRD